MSFLPVRMRISNLLTKYLKMTYYSHFSAIKIIIICLYFIVIMPFWRFCFIKASLLHFIIYILSIWIILLLDIAVILHFIALADISKISICAYYKNFNDNCMVWYFLKLLLSREFYIFVIKSAIILYNIFKGTIWRLIVNIIFLQLHLFIDWLNFMYSHISRDRAHDNV